MQSLAAEPAMTLVKRETVPVSEGQTVIRSHYLYRLPAVEGIQPKATTITKELIVVGCGVNYDANRGVGEPNLVPSHAALSPGGVEGVAFESTASPLEVFLPETADLPLIVGKNGRSVSSVIEGAAPAVPHAVDAHTARYENVFEDTDLEWQVGNGFLKETLTLRSPRAPTEFAFVLESPNLAFKIQDPSQAIFSYTEVGPTTRALKFSGHMMLVDAAAKDREYVMIPEPTVADANGIECAMECFLSRNANGSLTYHMRIPQAFLGDPGLVYPLTVDPDYYNPPTTGNPIVFEAGKTYLIQSTIYYYNKTVRIEGNAILKYKPSAALRFQSGDSVRVDGTPYNYAIFTSYYDDTVGVDTDGAGGADAGSPYPGSYNYALFVLSDTSGSGPIIRYGKFAYANWGVYVLPYATTLNPKIEHCVFRSNVRGIMSANYSNSKALNCTIRNCLFVGGDTPQGTGIYLHSYNGAPVWNVNNCTFGDLSYGISIISFSGNENKYFVKRNVFAECTYAIYTSGGTQPESTISYNGFDTQSQQIGTPSYLDTAPFVSNANGSYYIKTVATGGSDSEFLRKGDISAVEAGLSTRTTTAATGDRIVSQAITSDAVWSPIQRADETTVTLGYHYDPVDIIIQPPDPAAHGVPVLTVGENASLRVLPGVTIAFSDRPASAILNTLSLHETATLEMHGNGREPIRVSSTLLCGDKLGTASSEINPPVPGLGQTYLGIRLHDNPAEILYVTFEGAGRAIELAPGGNSTANIVGCRFAGVTLCGVLQTTGSVGGQPTNSKGGRIENCLFRDMGTWGVHSACEEGLEIVNCTFWNIVSAAISLGWQGSGSNHEIYNCILTDSLWGIYSRSGRPTKEDYNFFYQNGPSSPYGWDTNFPDPPFYQSEYGLNDIHEGDPDFEDATAPDLYARFHLGGSSPCINEGDPTVDRYLSTALDGSLDICEVDMGYHYPSRGLLRVAGNFFFEYQNGEYVYPISASLGPHSCVVRPTPFNALHPLDWKSGTFWTDTVPAYVETLARHGIDTMRIYPYVGSLFLQDRVESFRSTGVECLTSFTRALESKGLSYILAAFDSYAMKHCTSVFDRSDNCIYLIEDNYGTPTVDGTVHTYRRGLFFRVDASTRTARSDYQDSLDEILDNWFDGKSLVGWDGFAWIDGIETEYPFSEDENSIFPVYQENGSPFYFNKKMADWNYSWHEGALAGGTVGAGNPGPQETGWVPTMLGHITKTEIDSWHLGPGWNRPRWVSISSPFRFKASDPDKNGPAYADATSNSVVDYRIDISSPASLFEPLENILGEMRILTGSKDGNVYMWDARTLYNYPGTAASIPLRTYSGHSSPVLSVAYSPDFAIIATAGGADGSARLWNVTSGTEISPPSPITSTVRSGGVNDVQFHDLNNIILGWGDGWVEVRDTSTGNLVKYPTGPTGTTFTYLAHTGHVNSVADCPAEPSGYQNMILTGGWTGTTGEWRLRFYDTSSSPALWRENAVSWYPGEVVSVAFSPFQPNEPYECLALIGVGAGNDVAELWQVSNPFLPNRVGFYDKDTQTTKPQWQGHGSGINCVAFSPDGNSVVTGGSVIPGMGEWKLYIRGEYDGDPATREWPYQPNCMATGLYGEVYAVAVSGCKVVAATSSDSLAGFITVWDTSLGTPRLVHMVPKEGISVVFSRETLGAWLSTLPEIVDEYRAGPGNPGGFFSSGFRMNVQPGTISGPNKRFMNDLYHNQLWLGFATGSVGGPTPLACPGQHMNMSYYDLSGVYYLNERYTEDDPEDRGEFNQAVPLNYYTDEILDSMLSLSRFTSLVRWQYVKDSFRPVRSTSSTQDIVLLDQQYQAIPRYSIDGWLWTAASDGTITVGWIVHDYDYEGRAEWDYTANPASERPYLRVAGLSTADGDLELVWFDDRRGTIIKRESPFQATTYTVQLPETEGPGNGFGKSVAFLIQPVGYTPDREFAELPNELIGQIVVEDITSPVTLSWHEERPTAHQETLRFTGKTRPPIDPSQYRYVWTFATAPPVESNEGEDHYNHSPTSTGWYKIKLDILDKNQGDARVCGDIIYLRVLAQP